MRSDLSNLETLYLEDDDELGIHRSPVGAKTVMRHIDRYVDAIALANSPGGRWVDCACGSGYGTFIANQHATVIWGVDVNSLAITYATRHYTRPGTSFLVRDLSKPAWLISLNPDVLLSIETIEHLPRDLQWKFIATAARALRSSDPGGVMIMTVPLGNGPNARNPYHLHEPTYDEFHAMVGQHFYVHEERETTIRTTYGTKQTNLMIRAQALPEPS